MPLCDAAQSNLYPFMRELGDQMKSDAKVLEALALLERGNWRQAHAIVQQHET